MKEEPKTDSCGTMHYESLALIKRRVMKVNVDMSKVVVVCGIELRSLVSKWDRYQSINIMLDQKGMYDE